MVTTTSSSSTGNTVVTYTDPFMLGFDILNKRLSESMRANSGNFPPYNVRKISDETFIVELAIAGFNKNNVTITEESGTLTVEGSQDDDTSNEYLYKGIATRKFKRVWSLAEHMYVKDASMIDGILYITVIREVPEEKKPKVISIGSNGKSIPQIEDPNYNYVEEYKKWKSNKK